MGVSEAERAAAQELVVDIDVELGPELYPARDELEQAANYAEIVQVAQACSLQAAYLLLETFALRVASGLSERWPTAERLRVSVTKARVPVVPITDAACVEVTLGRGAS
jgi:dihydroneopterin aldolase